MTLCAQDAILKETYLTELFLDMHCDKNADGTKNLILPGNELIKKIGKRIRDRDLVKIAMFLRNHQDVIALELPYNEITDCGMSILVNFFKERPVIRYLNLIGNEIGPRGITYLSEFSEFLPLRTLRLSGNKIGDEGGRLLCKILKLAPNLKFLDISDTHQSAKGLAYILSTLIKKKGKPYFLEYIDISRPLPQTYHQVPDAHLAEQIINNHLKEIHAENLGFDFRDMEIITEGLFFNKSLICLNFNNNNIGDDGVEFLCNYLKTCPQLECLMIGANNFSDLGAIALGNALPFSKIRLLDITRNRITDEGMLRIFYTIKKMEKLRGLFIWGNKITHSSLVVLKQLFESKTLDPEHTDVKFNCVDNELRVGWDPRVNRFKSRFYCVSPYGYPPKRTIKRIPPPSSEPPPIHYRHHVDDVDVGLPLADWAFEWILPKFVYPL
ncbi:leucine-rich repeat-containing protein, putative [Pediculus humanus corporis]|uniref:Leucine-rich repeat-containing protein, putative n=1 Tax=Pediculus humanus subsp. corporis TaxID=121224 RepID=E0VWK5_PEDHC|nr:leucine-rich repeat-containing protein, putative [Pediculus humanus corporis]EEB17761.1 leucine-rich repeat-containing protein, putative [Pediculus humanus corporis]